MSHFILQTIKGPIEHDFVFQLKKALDYHNWVYQTLSHTYELSDVPLKSPDSYPVGDLQFVFDCLRSTHHLNPQKTRPLNVPESLSCDYYTRRLTHRSETPENPFNGYAFVKSDSVFKSVPELIEPKAKASFNDSSYFFSEEIDIDSEWRIFVHRNRILGLGHYAGDPLLMPDRHFIDNAVKDFKDAPLSYTIDVGINHKHNFIIETHPFVACGLYGFSNIKVLPDMFMDGIRYLKQ